MSPEEIDGIRAQIERQTTELAAYKNAIATVQKEADAAEEVIAPTRAAIVDCEQRIAAIKEEIAINQATINESEPTRAAIRAKLDALQSNATAIESAVYGCKVLIGEA